MQNDEIDLFELLQVLWNGKRLIVTFTAIAVLMGSGFLFVKKPVYESKLVYSPATIPPFYDEKKAVADFQEKFYSKSVFKEWEESHGNTSLVFGDFSKTEIVDGFILSKNAGDQLATLPPEKRGEAFILVRTNQLTVLDDFFKYASFINQALKREYVSRATSELNIIESRFSDLSSADSDIVQTVLSIDRYVVAAKEGANVLAIQNPTMPEKVSPIALLILALSIFLGGMIGAIVVLVSNAIRKRKEALVEA
jgi:LPS O-antigen subunit length determinant protein (WzzB/FepE family)